MTPYRLRPDLVTDVRRTRWLTGLASGLCLLELGLAPAMARPTGLLSGLCIVLWIRADGRLRGHDTTWTWSLTATYLGVFALLLHLHATRGRVMRAGVILVFLFLVCTTLCGVLSIVLSG